MRKDKQKSREQRDQEAKASRAAVKDEYLAERVVPTAQEIIARLNATRARQALEPRVRYCDSFIADWKLQASWQGELAKFALDLGYPQDAGYFAKCAWNLARNAVEVDRLGRISTDIFMDWVREQEQRPGYAKG